MRALLIVFIMIVSLSCHQDIARNDQLYGKWILTGGSALPKRQKNMITQPIYLTFTTSGSIESNWSNCYGFQFGSANTLIVNDNCLDCIVVDCGREIWHYQFTDPTELTIDFGPGDVGYLRR